MLLSFKAQCFYFPTPILYFWCHNLHVFIVHPLTNYFSLAVFNSYLLNFTLELYVIYTEPLLLLLYSDFATYLHLPVSFILSNDFMLLAGVLYFQCEDLPLAVMVRQFWVWWTLSTFVSLEMSLFLSFTYKNLLIHVKYTSLAVFPFSILNPTVSIGLHVLWNSYIHQGLRSFHSLFL